MVWKDEYKLGDELIDTQHEELFSRAGKLMKIVAGEDAVSRKQECIDAILFLKDYAVNHFAAEEAFQESLNYRFLDFHKAIHSSFVESVLEAEKKLVASNFSLPVIKEFCGFLSMWLIYHVAGADQKIVDNDVMSVAEFAIAVSYEDCVLESLKSVLGTIFGDSLEAEKTNKKTEISNGVQVETEYDETRNMRFTLSLDTALWIVNTITDLRLVEIDELANAVLTQFAKTICGNAASHMSKHGQTTGDIKAQQGSLIDEDEFVIVTKFGRISTALVRK